MGRPAFRAFAPAITAVLLAACFPLVANADPVLVYPGMEIHQGTHLCTLGYVDPGLRVAFTAGHCRGDGPVADKDNHLIGKLATFRDNTPNGAIVDTDQQIADYESIVLANDVTVNNILPGGRVLQSDPGLVVTPGEPVCHFGVVTGETCGTVESINNGLVHDGKWRRQSARRLRRAGLHHPRRRARPDRRDIQQRLGRVSGSGIVAVHHPANPRGCGRRRSVDLEISWGSPARKPGSTAPQRVTRRRRNPASAPRCGL